PRVTAIRSDARPASSGLQRLEAAHLVGSTEGARPGRARRLRFPDSDRHDVRRGGPVSRRPLRVLETSFCSKRDRHSNFVSIRGAAGFASGSLVVAAAARGAAASAGRVGFAIATPSVILGGIAPASLMMTSPDVSLLPSETRTGWMLP